MEHLEDTARRVRKKLLRIAVAEPSVHLGASLSCLDILVALFFRVMRRKGKDRDYLILSKGHAVPALYAVLAEAGLIPEDELETIRDVEGRLEGHPELTVPGIDMVSGSLGQGLSIAAGIAYAMKLKGSRGRVFVVLGDGELDEGQVWEAAATIAHLKLTNVVAIVDVNGYQLDGRTSQVKDKGRLEEKWRSWGWDPEWIDGHDYKQLVQALERAAWGPRPKVILARTVRGKGLKPLETNGGQRASRVDAARALAEIDA